MEKVGPVELSLLTPISRMSGEDDDETKELHAFYAEAERFLLDFRWCGGVIGAYLGYGVGGILGVFYFEIAPKAVNVDKYFWVIVGDIPSAYVVTDKAKSPREAVAIYIELFREWVEAVKTGSSIKDLVPANVPPTLENAKLLETRLSFLDKNILKEIP